MRYAKIDKCEVCNGEGVGVALFVQGCPFQCYNCFNQETWDFNGGKKWTDEVKQKFLNMLDKSYIKRASILGGEPLAENNLSDVLDLVNEIRISYPDKTIWIYSGYEWYDIFYKSGYFYPQMIDTNRMIRQEILSKCDVFVDGRYIDSQRDISLKWRGSKNQRVIDIQKSIKQNEVVLYCD